jgi:preprotein translocase subunit SecA
LEESLEIDSSRLAMEDWDTIGERILEGINQLFERRLDRYLGEQGSIVKDLDTILAKLNNPPLQRGHLTYLLVALTEGQRTSFDKKTHRRVWTRTTRLIYTYYAAQLIKDRDPDDVTADVLGHLKKAEETIRRSLGAYELQQLSGQSINSLDVTLQAALQNTLGQEQIQKLAGIPISSLPVDLQQSLVDFLGRRAQTNNYRGLLLGVITELWVDYLTQMEALRISIGLEAYAQRDPLVQYKSQAYELFQQLLDNMRLGVVMRMFTYRPRQAAPKTTWDDTHSSEQPDESDQPQDTSESENPEDESDRTDGRGESVPVGVVQTAESTEARISTSKKRRRRRR